MLRMGSDGLGAVQHWLGTVPMAVVVAGHRATWKPLCVGKMRELRDFDECRRRVDHLKDIGHG
jgi:hypothetical protein